MWPFRPRRTPQNLGKHGELLAKRLLRRRGLRILAENYRCPAGEADLIALDRSTKRVGGAETLCFVEVKTRTSDEYAQPASAVHADKRRRLRKVAETYLAARDAEDYAVRFDVITVVRREGEKPRIEYIPDAF